MELGEFLMAFTAAVNNGLAPYQPSRNLTRDECAFGLSVGRLIDPLYDLSYDDPTRADPGEVLDYWRNSEILTEPEINQLAQIFAGQDLAANLAAAATVAAQPASDAVAIAASVYVASSEYWGIKYGGPSASGGENPLQRDLDDDDIRYIKSRTADSLGAIVGGIFGGFIGGALVSGATSIIFFVEEGCWPDPCGGGPQLPPAPCGGYHGIGPCP